MSDVLINFIGKVDQLVPAEDALESIIQKEGAVGDAWKKVSQTFTAETKTIFDGSGKLGKSIENLASSAKTFDKAAIGGAYKDYLKQIQAQLGLTNKELIAFIKNARSAAQQNILSGGTDEEIKGLTASIEVMNDQLKALGDTELNTEEKTKSLRTRLREAKEELVALAEAGLQGTPAFNQLKQEAAQLDDQIKDLNAEISNLGSDTRNVEGLIGVANGLVGGYTAFQGILQLTGAETEDYQEALVKLNAAMAILQGLQQIQNLLQKESAAALLVQRVATIAQAAASSTLAFATGGATIAVKAFRTALVTTGIGALVVGLGFLVDALMSAEDAQEGYNESIDTFLGLLDAELQGIKNIGTRIDIELQRQGASQVQRGRATIQNLRIQKNAVNREIIEIEQSISSVNRTADDNKKIEDLYQKRFDLGAEIAQKEIDLEKEVASEQKSRLEKSRELAERNAKAVFEIKKRAIEQEASLFQSIADNESNDYRIRLAAVNEYVTQKLNLLNLEEQFEKTRSGLTKQEILNIEDDFNKQRAQITRDGLGLRNTIYQQYNTQLIEDQKKSDEEELKAFEEKLQSIRNNVTKGFGESAKLNASELDASLEQLKERFGKGQITLEDYIKKRQNLLDDNATTTLNNEIAQTEALIANLRAYGIDVSDQEEKLYQLKEKRRQRDIEAHKKANEEKSKNDGEWFEKNKQFIQAGAQLLQQGINALLEVNDNRRQAAFDAEQKRLNEQRDKELSNKELTELQKDAINKKYQKQEAELKRRAYIADQNAKAQQAIINGFLGATQSIAQLGIPAGLLTAGLAIAFGGIQAAAIRGREIPAFKRGKVNIDGPGTATSDSILARISAGESVINASATKKWQEALEAINENRFEQYVFKQFVYPHIPETVKTATGGIDYRKMAQIIASEISGVLPEPLHIENTIDEDGLHSFVISKNSKTEIRNKRYSIG